MWPSALLHNIRTIWICLEEKIIVSVSNERVYFLFPVWFPSPFNGLKPFFSLKPFTGSCFELGLPLVGMIFLPKVIWPNWNRQSQWHFRGRQQVHMNPASKVQKIFLQGSVEGKIVWNQLWEHRFSVPDPRVFPPPGDRFSAQTTENQIYNRACSERGSWVIVNSKAWFPYDRCDRWEKKGSAIIWKPLSSDRSDNDLWERTFSTSAIVVAAIAGKWFLYDRCDRSTFFFSAIVAIIWKPGLNDK